MLPGTRGLCKEAGARGAACFEQHGLGQLEHEVRGRFRRLIGHHWVESFAFISVMKVKQFIIFVWHSLRSFII